MEYARRRGYDALITFDADGQHNPHDIPLLLEKLKDADLVIGIRAINSHEMPYVKRLGNMGLNLFTRIVFGVTSKDSQSGLRAFNRKAIESIRLRTNRYEVSSEILFEARTKNLKIKEVEVHTIYTLYSKGRGTGVLDGFKILWRMLIHNKVH
ncbi:MAG: glycosyltransferase family 2 protein [Candidatus Altiarchaeota archaeon]|nr:glycosyltransferase family 2 protein [Candidatus Altiarchaeota archaeon]